MTGSKVMRYTTLKLQNVRDIVLVELSGSERALVCQISQVNEVLTLFTGLNLSIEAHLIQFIEFKLKLLNDLSVIFIS